jgi:hypothetical protein
MRISWIRDSVPDNSALALSAPQSCLAEVGPLFPIVAETLGEQAAQGLGRVRPQLLHVRLEEATPHHEQDLVLN